MSKRKASMPPGLEIFGRFGAIFWFDDEHRAMVRLDLQFLTLN